MEKRDLEWLAFLLLLLKNILESAAIIISASMKHYRAVVKAAALSLDYAFSECLLAKWPTIGTSQRSTFAPLIGRIVGGSCQSKGI
jgi:hypothetical protein